MRRPVAGEADMGPIRRFQTPHGQRWRGVARAARKPGCRTGAQKKKRGVAPRFQMA